MPFQTNESPRFLLYEAQGGRCAGCGDRVPFSKITADHIVPKSQGGGGYDRGNIQLMCADCNNAKGDGTQLAFEYRLHLWREQGRRCADCGSPKRITKVKLVNSRAVCKRGCKSKRRKILGVRYDHPHLARRFLVVMEPLRGEADP